MRVGSCLLLFATFAIITCLPLGQLPILASHATSYLPVTGPCHLVFPRDHGSHPGYRTEWWYYTGNLRSSEGKRFGFQLTFFRSQIGLPGVEKEWPQPASAWRTNQLFIAHIALSDIDGKHFLHAEDIGRGALEIAGVEQESDVAKVFLKKWSARLTPEKHFLEGASDHFSFRLTLTPQKKPVLHGNEGYSLKGSTPERASCYYSFTRLGAQGVLTYEEKKLPVSGLAWMDHEYSSAPLEEDLAGWDWFSLQLSDGAELMLYLLRKKDGGYSNASGGSFVDLEGNVSHLDRSSLDVRILDYWVSPKTGARYPSHWRLRVDSPSLDLMVIPNLPEQEIQSPETTRVTYWEGSVSAKGASLNGSVTGSGYVELTGYEKPFDAPL
jgi:predicted secreted hydrolase